MTTRDTTDKDQALPSGRVFYPEPLPSRKWWIDWVRAYPLTDDGGVNTDAVPTKQPIAPYRNGSARPVRWHFGLEDDEHPSTDYETVRNWKGLNIGIDLPTVERVISDTVRIGIIIPPTQEEQTITLLDWDDVRDPKTGHIHPVAAWALEMYDGYAEISQSGKGIHQFVFGEIPGGLKKFIRQIDDQPFVGDDLPAIEMYQSGRVCAMTGEHVADSGEDIVDGQELLDHLCWKYGTGKNKATSTPTDPFAKKREGAGDATPDHDTVSDALQETQSYTGPGLNEWSIREDRSLEYEAVLRARERSDDLAGVANWELLGYAAALGYRDGLDKETIVQDLQEYPTPQYGYDDSRARKEVRSVFRKAESGNYNPPTRSRLAERGILPEELGYGSDADPVVSIPMGALDALTPDERKRYARKRGFEIPSTDDVRRRFRDAVFRELRAENTTVLDGPTALGKSYTIATEPWHRQLDVTGDAPVIQLHQTRKARDEAYRASRETSGVTTERLLGRKEASPLARGDYDPVEDPEAAPDVVVTIDGEPASEWFDRMCDKKGIPFSTALAIARERNDQGLDDLPPVGGEDPAVAQWDGLPRDDDGTPAVDVIHATHHFAYVPSLRSHTNVILDEQPDYRIDLSQDQVQRMVTAYLQEIGAPVSTWEAFVSLARFDGDGRSDAQAEQEALNDAVGDDPHQEWYADDPDAHALAPDLTRALWNALRWENPDRNDRRSSKVLHEPPRFDAGNSGSYGGTWLSAVIDEDNRVHSVRSTPDFSQARAVVGLDAHPSMPLWELNGPPEITRDAVLDSTERRLWRRYERGLTVVQISDSTRPRSGSNARKWMNDGRVRAILDRLRDYYGSEFKTALSTRQTESAVRRLLADVGGDRIDSDSTMHYGEEKSRNDFANESAGYVYGCMDPGDRMILNVLAELELDATPSIVEGNDGKKRREKGRTFDGPDADTAAAVLASVRENHVAQAAGRYARNPDDPDSQATVYIDTNAAPTGFVDIEAPGVEWLATDLQRKIIDSLAEYPSATTRELADAAGCTKEHVRETLQRLVDRDLVSRAPGMGEYGADVFRDIAADTAIVDLAETTNSPLSGSNRWSLAVRPRNEDANTTDEEVRTLRRAVNRVGLPPDPTG